jgi:hypothetical protein
MKDINIYKQCSIVCTAYCLIDNQADKNRTEDNNDAKI